MHLETISEVNQTQKVKYLLASLIKEIQNISNEQNTRQLIESRKRDYRDRKELRRQDSGLREGEVKITKMLQVYVPIPKMNGSYRVPKT